MTLNSFDQNLIAEVIYVKNRFLYYTFVVAILAWLPLFATNRAVSAGYLAEEKYLTSEFWETATLESISSVLNKENVNSINSFEQTPLRLAARYSKDPAVIEWLVSMGAEIEFKDTRFGRTPLMWAITPEPRLAIIEALVRLGADVNAVSNSSGTPLIYAATVAQDPRIFEILLKAGADVHSRDDRGQTALLTAAMMNPNPEVFSRLVAFGSKVDDQDLLYRSPLMLAAANGSVSVIEIIAKLTGDIDAPNANGVTALQQAVESNEAKALETLVKLGADLNRASEYGLTPLMRAVDQRSPNLEIVKFLVNSGANIRAKDRKGKDVFAIIKDCEAQMPENKAVLNKIKRILNKKLKQ